MTTSGFLAAPEVSTEAQRLFDDDVADAGYVMNLSKVWAYQPATATHLFELMGETHAVEHLSIGRCERVHPDAPTVADSRWSQRCR